MAGRLLDTDPERAYEHAQAAAHRGGRVDVVREAAGLAAYRTGRYAEALRELRTVRRLNGSSEHLAIMADCERGLGRPDRAVALAGSPEAEELGPEARIELAIVLSGARLDLGEAEAAVAALSGTAVQAASGVQAVRVAQARAAALEAAGRTVEAATVLEGFTSDELAEAAGEVEVDDEIVVYDLEPDEDDSAASDEKEAALGEDSAAADPAPRDGAVPSDDAVRPTETLEGEGSA